jgi:hypothetical protein
MRKLLWALLGACLGTIAGLALSGPAALAAGPSAGTAAVFAVYRDGEAIGRHSIAIAEKDDVRIVEVNIDITLRKMGIVTYRYLHHGSETWSGDSLLSLKANTDDNSRLYTVEARRTANGLEVERTAPAQLSAVDIADQGYRWPEVTRETFPPETLPTTLWNIDCLRRPVLLNTQYGTLSRIEVTTVGRESLPAGSVPRETTHYRVAGDLQMDQWFDDNGRWIKATFRAPDGSTVQYVLQE